MGNITANVILEDLIYGKASKEGCENGVRMAWANPGG